MRQTILQFSLFLMVYLHVSLSIISNLIMHVSLSLFLWLFGNTRELISFTGSGCNGFIPQDLITVRCPMCAGFKHPVCQLGLSLSPSVFHLPHHPTTMPQNVWESPSMLLMLIIYYEWFSVFLLLLHDEKRERRDDKGHEGDFSLRYHVYMQENTKKLIFRAAVINQQLF